MASNLKWTVTLSQSAALAQVEHDLRQAGFEIESVLGEIGVITGSAASEVAEKVADLPGVADITREGRIDIGPPGSGDTW